MSVTPEVNVIDLTLVEQRALEAHEDWYRHVKSCKQCLNPGPFCEIGIRLDSLAEKWERRI